MVTGAGNSGRKLRWHERLRTLTQAKGGGRSDYLEPVATSLLLSLSLSPSLSPFSGELGSQIVKRFIFIFRPWNLGQGRKIKMLLFSLTLSLRLEKRCCCQVVFILSLHDACDYKQELMFVETRCLRFSLHVLPERSHDLIHHSFATCLFTWPG